MKYKKENILQKKYKECEETILEFLHQDKFETSLGEYKTTKEYSLYDYREYLGNKIEQLERIKFMSKGKRFKK